MRHCTCGRKLVAPWLHPGSKTKQERWACEESQAENQFLDSLTPGEQLAIADPLMSSKHCEQYLFSSEIHGKERSEESKTSLTARVTCEWCAVKLRIVISAGGSRLRTLMTHRSHALSFLLAIFLLLNVF